MTLLECPLSTDRTTVSLEWTIVALFTTLKSQNTREEIGSVVHCLCPAFPRDMVDGQSGPLSFSGSLSTASGQDHRGPRSNWHPALRMGYACQSGQYRNKAYDPNQLCGTLDGRCLNSHGCAMTTVSFACAWLRWCISGSIRASTLRKPLASTDYWLVTATEVLLAIWRMVEANIKSLGLSSLYRL